MHSGYSDSSLLPLQQVWRARLQWHSHVTCTLGLHACTLHMSAAVCDEKERKAVSVAEPRLVFQTRKLSLTTREIPGRLKDHREDVYVGAVLLHRQ